MHWLPPHENSTKDFHYCLRDITVNGPTSDKTVKPTCGRTVYLVMKSPGLSLARELIHSKKAAVHDLEFYYQPHKPYLLFFLQEQSEIRSAYRGTTKRDMTGAFANIVRRNPILEISRGRDHCPVWFHATPSRPISPFTEPDTTDEKSAGCISCGFVPNPNHALIVCIKFRLSCKEIICALHLPPWSRIMQATKTRIAYFCLPTMYKFEGIPNKFKLGKMRER